MSLPLFATLALAGVAALDATPVAQSMLSQPLVTAVLLGYLWGDVMLALQVGIVLQILAASTLPVGARTPEDYAVGGVVGTALALILAREQSLTFARDGCAFVGVITGLVTATLGVPIIKWQRRRNEGLGRWSEAEVRAGITGALGSAHRAAVALAFAAGVAWAALALAVSHAAFRPLVGSESVRLARAWSLAHPLWLGLGIAQLLQAFVQRRLLRAAVFGVALLGAWLVLLVGAP